MTFKNKREYINYLNEKAIATAQKVDDLMENNAPIKQVQDALYENTKARNLYQNERRKSVATLKAKGIIK